MIRDVILLGTGEAAYARVQKRQFGVRIIHSMRWKADGFLCRRTANATELNRDIMKEFLSEAKAKLPDVLSDVAVVLPQGFTWYQYIELAELSNDEQEARDFLKWKLAKEMPIDPDDADIRFEVLSRNNDQMKILVAATFKAFVNDIDQSLADFGMEATLIMPPTLAAMNALSSEMPQNGTFVWLRGHGYSMVSFSAGNPLLIRETDRNLEPSRIDPEVFGFTSMAQEHYHDIKFDRTVVADEAARSDISSFLPDNATVIDTSRIVSSDILSPDQKIDCICIAGVFA